jgi:hypothetical protein
MSPRKAAHEEPEGPAPQTMTSNSLEDSDAINQKHLFDETAAPENKPRASRVKPKTVTNNAKGGFYWFRQPAQSPKTGFYGRQPYPILNVEKQHHFQQIATRRAVRRPH